MQTRAICKSLRTRNPELKIVVGRWTGRNSSERAQRLLKASCADATAASLSQMRETLQPIIQFRRTLESESPGTPSTPLLKIAEEAP